MLAPAVPSREPECGESAVRDHARCSFVVVPAALERFWCWSRQPRTRSAGTPALSATGFSRLDSAPVSAQQVDEYLRAVEEPKRGTLETLRSTILEIVPEAKQVTSYRVPAFRVRGQTVAGLPPSRTT